MDWAAFIKIAAGTLVSEDLTLVAALYSYKSGTLTVNFITWVLIWSRLSRLPSLSYRLL